MQNFGNQLDSRDLRIPAVFNIADCIGVGNPSELGESVPSQAPGFTGLSDLGRDAFGAGGYSFMTC